MNRSKANSPRHWKKLIAAGAVTPGNAIRTRLAPGVLALRFTSTVSAEQAVDAIRRCGGRPMTASEGLELFRSFEPTLPTLPPRVPLLEWLGRRWTEWEPGRWSKSLTPLFSPR